MKIRLKKDVVNISGKVDCAEKSKVTPFGNGAKIDYDKKFIGREVLVVLLKQ